MHEVKYLMLLERTDIPPSATLLFERRQELNKYVYTLEQIALWYNELKQSTLSFEYALIEDHMVEIDVKLKPAEVEYSWNSRGIYF